MTYIFTSSSRPPTPPFPPGPYGRPSSPFGSPYGRPRRVASGFLGGLIVGLVELLVFMLVARWLGPGLTVLLMLATSVVGVWLLRLEGAKSWRSFRDSLIEGRPPGRSATEGLLVLVGGVLMVLPGFVGDLVGAFLVAPPTRRIAVRWAESAVARRLTPAAATSLFGPRTVRVRTGAPRPTPPPGDSTSGPSASGASASGGPAYGASAPGASRPGAWTSGGPTPPRQPGGADAGFPGEPIEGEIIDPR
jgi:UPF0716 protein FxsA